MGVWSKRTAPASDFSQWVSLLTCTMPHPDLAISYGLLPQRFFTRLSPTKVAAPRLIKFNEELAADLGIDLDGVGAPELAQIFAGNRLLPGSEPLAMAYAGHQFGHFVPQLGDGRAITLAEVRDRHGVRRDIQLKGAGRTPYSRGGDGRAALGPILREYLVSEAMHAMGVPSTRALAAVVTGEPVMRGEPLPGAILTRVALGYVRVGTFQFFAATGDIEAVRLLADHVIERHYPDVGQSADRYLELLRRVVSAQADLIARWMLIGFVHGVMNTDNMSVAGETIDFGPCAFLDSYDPMTVFSSIDQHGRYAFANQPHAAQWNLARFAETLVPLLDDSAGQAVRLATEAIGSFSKAFEANWLAGMRLKVGLTSERAEDGALIRELLDCIQRGESDYTLTFRRLSDSATDDAAVLPLFAEPDAMSRWLDAWRMRLRFEPRPVAERVAAMRRVNPAVIPRNHRVEAAIAAAMHEDYGPFETLKDALSRPYEQRPADDMYELPPEPDERVRQTFCGT